MTALREEDIVFAENVESESQKRIEELEGRINALEKIVNRQLQKHHWHYVNGVHQMTNIEKERESLYW